MNMTLHYGWYSHSVQSNMICDPMFQLHIWTPVYKSYIDVSFIQLLIYFEALKLTRLLRFLKIVLSLHLKYHLGNSRNEIIWEIFLIL